MRISKNDWEKLSALAERTAGQLQMRLPPEWLITKDEIQSAAYGEIAELITQYKDGAMGVVSYCWQYCEMRTLDTLMREWTRLKKEIILDGNATVDPVDGSLRITPSEDDSACKSETGEMEVIDRTSLAENLEQRDIIEQIRAKASTEDRAIMDEMLEGRTLEEIAQKHGTDKKAVQRKLRRLSQLV